MKGYSTHHESKKSDRIETKAVLFWEKWTLASGATKCDAGFAGNEALTHSPPMRVARRGEGNKGDKVIDLTFVRRMIFQFVRFVVVVVVDSEW